MTKTESGNYHLGGLGCQEMDSTRSNVKEGTGGGGMEFNLAMNTRNLKINGTF